MDRRLQWLHFGSSILHTNDCVCFLRRILLLEKNVCSLDLPCTFQVQRLSGKWFVYVTKSELWDLNPNMPIFYKQLASKKPYQPTTCWIEKWRYELGLTLTPFQC